MDDVTLNHLRHPATVPKSLASHPPLLLAMQLAGATFCASLSHALLQPLQVPTSLPFAAPHQAAVHALASRALAGPLSHALAAHYGAHALARGRQKPLGPCFRSRTDQQGGTHSGRNRALWRQGRRGLASRTWCPRCGFPQARGGRTLHLPLRRPLSVPVCVHCLTRAQHALARPLPDTVEACEVALHTALRGLRLRTGTGTQRSSHRRRAPRTRPSRRRQQAPPGTTTTTPAMLLGRRQTRRVAASVASTAALVPSSAAPLTARVKVPALVDGPTRPAAVAASCTPMTQLARAVPKGPITRAAPPPRLSAATPPAATTKTTTMTTPRTTRAPAPPRAVAAKKSVAAVPKSTATAKKVLDVMKSLGI